MIDNAWTLRPQAVRYAYDCIHLIQELEGLRLKMSQPDFLLQLQKRVEKYDSPALATAFANLIAMDEVGSYIKKRTPKSLESKEHVVNVESKRKSGGDANEETANNEMIEFNGHFYSRYRNGGEFKGLYRGMPRYA